MGDTRTRVPIGELVDLEQLTASLNGQAPTPANLRAALPPGWALDDDPAFAKKDLRLLFRRGWLLAIGMLLFGAAGILFFIEVFPRGWSGVMRFMTLLAILGLVGGVVGPMITRALSGKSNA